MATGMITGKAIGKRGENTIIVTHKVAGVIATVDMFGYPVAGDN
jgi:hypothetical protein